MLRQHKQLLLLLEISLGRLQIMALFLDFEVQFILFLLVDYLSLLDVFVGLSALGDQILILHFHLVHELLGRRLRFEELVNLLLKLLNLLVLLRHLFV